MTRAAEPAFWGQAFALGSSWASEEDSSRWASAWASRSVAFCSTAATASAPATQRSGGSSLAGELDERAGELGGVAALLAVHRLPGVDGVLGALGVVVDRRLRPGRRGVLQQIGAEEAGLDEHRVDAERGDLGGERLHPAFDRELRRGVGGGELLTDDAGGRGDRHDHAARWRRMTGRTARVTLSGPKRLVSIWARKCSGLISSKNPA